MAGSKLAKEEWCVGRVVLAVGLGEVGEVWEEQFGE